MGWLDTLIQDKATPKHPKSNLAVIFGAVTKAHIALEASWDEYKCILNKGQVLPHDMIKTVVIINFIYEGQCYSFTATCSSLTSWTLYLNGTMLFL